MSMFLGHVPGTETYGTEVGHLFERAVRAEVG
jgi:hypothetical protein